MNILICDDNQMTLEVNYTYVVQLSKKFKVVPVIYKFCRIDEKLISAIKNINFDIAFLDIDIGADKNGIDIAKGILHKNKWCSIIFITSHTEYSFQALDVLCHGFLKKPVKEEKLELLFSKAIISCNSIIAAKNSKILNFISNRESVSIRQSMIRYLERQQQKIIIETEKSSYEVYDTLKNIEANLDSNFFKIQSGLIVNIEKVLVVNGNEVTLNNGEVFTISRARKKQFYKLLRPDVT